MDVRFINPFLEGTVSVLKTMAMIEPKAGKPYVKKGNQAKGDVSAIIGMTGSASGSLALSFTERCILKIVSNMLGEDHKEINGDINDAVGEITNMISGVARKCLEAEGMNIVAAIPTVVSGKNHSIIHVLGGPSVIIPFETPDGDFFVDVCMNDVTQENKR
jgi:chemotaxis protein CheX